MNHFSHERGFTLLETIFVAALSAVMMGAVSMLIYNFNTTASYQKAVIQSSGSAGALLRDIGSLIVPANAILQTHTFSSATYASSPTTLVLEIPSIDNLGNVIANTYDYAVVYTTGTDAYRTLEANALSSRTSGTKKLSSTILALTFSYDSADVTLARSVTADVQVQAALKTGLISAHQREQFSLRNR